MTQFIPLGVTILASGILVYLFDRNDRKGGPKK